MNYDLQKQLELRMKEILDEEAKQIDKEKFFLCQNGIRWSWEIGSWVLILVLQDRYTLRTQPYAEIVL